MLKSKKFITDEDGNVAMMFGITISLLLFLTGVAVDFSNVTRLQNKLQSQVDAGVLAAATLVVDGTNNPGKNKAMEKQLRKEAAFGVLEANGFEKSSVDPVLVIKKASVTLKAELEYKPFFGKLMGRDKMKLVAESESGLPNMTALDVVLVLDNTDSMSVEGKMDALKTGATDLITAIKDSNSDSKVGMVPFARYVRVNKSFEGESWLAVPPEYDTPRTYEQATHSGGTCVDVTKERDVDGVTETYETTECTGQTTTYETKNTTVESRWDGCVGTRISPYSEQDGSYSFEVPGLLNKVPHEVTPLNWDISTWCPAEIRPLTDKYDELIGQVSWLWPTDNTYLPMGLMWGQRVLSPGAPYDNVERDSKKVMIFMTDGMNTLKVDNTAFAQTEFRAPPYISNVADPNAGSPEADVVTARLCKNIKDSDIEIYTIAFKVTDSKTKKLLRDCASNPSNSLTADNNTALIKQFEKISNKLKDEVRLMR